jgi:hypothetical protein
LEQRRICGWLGCAPSAARPIAWSGAGVVAYECPVSLSAGLGAWIELYALWHSGVMECDASWSAKDLDALAVLAGEERHIEQG